MSALRVLRTAAPGRFVVLYDGFCRFCSRESKRLARLTRQRVEHLDFQEPGTLERFPGITYEDCMEEMILVTPDGRVFGGAEAIVRALGTRLLYRLLLLPYFVPGFRQLVDATYRMVSRIRYRLAGGGCDGGTCELHFR